MLLLSGKQWNEVSKCPNCGVSPVDPTPEYRGIISNIFPKDSWVAKWNGLSSKIPGLYAISIENYENEYEDDLHMKG